MSLLSLYNNWTFKSISPLPINKNARKQSDGEVAVDFLPNTYQTEVKNRTPGSTTVIQSTGTDTTNGTFRPITALRYYSTLINSPLKSFKSKLVHKYNAQGADTAKYITSNTIKNTPGAIYRTNS